MARPLVNPGMLQWTGQHWINYLREPDTETNSGMVSLWYTHYCEAGEGGVAFVDLPGNTGFQGIYTDHPDVAVFMQNWMRGRGGLYDMALTVFDAKIWREGEIRTTSSWIIQTATDRIEATWSRVRAPVILDGPAPKFSDNRDVYSLLFFAEEATITLNGHGIPGKPYTTDVWKPSIGGDRSSCVFALSETFIQVP